MTIILTTDNLPGAWREATPTELLEGFSPYQNDETGYQAETIEEVAELEEAERAKENAQEILQTLSDFAEAVEAYLVHGDGDLKKWIAKARKQVAIVRDDKAEIEYQDNIIGQP